MVVHEGLAKFLKDDGYQVLNLSQLGSSNTGVLKSIINYFITNPGHSVEKIFVFQTDWCRDVYHHSTLGRESSLIGNSPAPPSIPVADCTHAFSYRDTVLGFFYRGLSALGQQFNIDIFLIGGFSDVLAYDRFSLEYPRVSCACRSAVSLAVYNDPDLTPLTTGFLNPVSYQLANFMKKQLPQDQLPILTEEIDLGNRRLKLFEKRPDIFPDRQHGGKILHQAVYDLLKTKNIV